MLRAFCPSFLLELLGLFSIGEVVMSQQSERMSDAIVSAIGAGEGQVRQLGRALAKIIDAIEEILISVEGFGALFSTKNSPLSEFADRTTDRSGSVRQGISGKIGKNPIPLAILGAVLLAGGLMAYKYQSRFFKGDDALLK
jgi:hypothetical protein